MSIKASKNFSFSKSSEAIGTIVARTLNKMARHLNASIQKGIDTSTDIHGKKFKRLSEDSTLPIRNKRKHGFTPLDTMQTTPSGRQSSRSLRATRITTAKPKDLFRGMTSKIRMVQDHGLFHNEGFVTGKTSMIPNKKVEKREWFGITKEMKPGGSAYENFVRLALRSMVKSLRK